MAHLKRYFSYLFTCVIVLLSGCQSEETTESNVKVEAPIHANDGLLMAITNEKAYLDVSAFVQADKNGMLVSDISRNSESGTCVEPEQDQLGFYVIPQSDGACEYQYQVSSIETKETKTSYADARIVLISSVNNQADFTPISLALMMGTQTTIDLTVELGTDFPTGYQLASEVSVVGSGHVVVDALTNTITYHATAEGLSRLVYTLEGTLNGLPDNQVGYIDVAVSSSATQPPVTAQFRHLVNPIIGQQIDIDLAPYVSDPDGDDVQLIEVLSFHATVVSKAPLDLVNKAFTFSTTQAGLHYVSYLVSDHQGGFSSNLVEIEVIDPNQVAQWTDITYDLDSYIAPLTAIEASIDGVAFSGTYKDTNYTPSIEMATFNHSDAHNYCLTIGRLPTSGELTDLAINTLPSTIYNWPNELYYLASDGGVKKLVEMDTGNVIDYFNGVFYVSCHRDDGGLTLNAITPLAVANSIDKVEVEIELLLNNIPAVGEVVSATVTGSAVLDSASVTTDANGKAIFRATSLKAETIIFTIDYASQITRMISVTFKADTDKSKLISNILIKDKADADGVQKNITVARVEDDNGNPVANQPVTIMLAEHGIISGSASAPATLQTNLDGEVIIEVTNTEEEIVDVIAYYTSTNSPPEITDEVARMNFYILNTIKPLEQGGLMWTGPFTPNEVINANIKSGGLLPTPDKTYIEDGSVGPNGMEVARYTWLNSDDFCYFLNYMGYTDWSLPTQAELQSLYSSTQPDYPILGMFGKYNWATYYSYWAMDPAGVGMHAVVRLYDGNVDSHDDSFSRYVSCVR